jgi:hypothetical protein
MTVLLVAIALFMLPAQAAFAWTVPGAGGANSFAALLSANEAPSASVASGTATVSWNAVTFTGSSTAATGYTVNRVWRGDETGPDNVEDGDKEPAEGSCAGVVTGLSCTTPHSAGQTWSYTITPLYEGWTGTESAESTPITAVVPVAPTVQSVSLFNNGTLGQVNNGDYFTITYSGVLDPQSICSDFTTDLSASQTATGMTFEFAGNPNVISITNNGTCGTSGLGTLQVGGNTGATRYSQQSAMSFAGTLQWNPDTRTITVTFGALQSGTARTGVPAADAVYTPGALSGDGLPIDATPFTATNQGF